MEEIRIGEYVRCKNGKIAKIKNIENEFMYFDKEIYWKDEMPIFELENIFKDFILKHSSNIIDLIEVGDYVNGLYIHGIYEDGLEVYRYGDYHDILYADEIKSICTKEQFKNIEYKVEE